MNMGENRMRLQTREAKKITSKGTILLIVAIIAAIVMPHAKSIEVSTQAFALDYDPLKTESLMQV